MVMFQNSRRPSSTLIQGVKKFVLTIRSICICIHIVIGHFPWAESVEYGFLHSFYVGLRDGATASSCLILDTWYESRSGREEFGNGPILPAFDGIYTLRRLLVINPFCIAYLFVLASLSSITRWQRAHDRMMDDGYIDILIHASGWVWFYRGRGDGGGILMETHADHWPRYNAGTEHVGFSPARLRFTKLILVTSYHPCVARPTGFCYEIIAIPRNAMLYIFRRHDYTRSAGQGFDLWSHA